MRQGADIESLKLEHPHGIATNRQANQTPSRCSAILLTMIGMSYVKPYALRLSWDSFWN